jgi:hypothetical protein
LNGWPEEMMPTLKPESVSFKNAQELAAVLRDLSTAGIQVDRQDEAVQEIMDLMGLSRLQPLEEIDTDLVMSAEQSQQMAMDIAGMRTGIVETDNDDDSGGRPAANNQNADEVPEEDE